MRRNWQCAEWKKINDMNYTACESKQMSGGWRGREVGTVVHAALCRQS